MNLKNKQQAASLFDLLPQSKEEQRILSERAAQFAKVKLDKAFNVQKTNYIRFKLGEKQHYGIPIQFIEEVLVDVKLTPIPNAPGFIAGIFNRNGVLITALDLKSYFNIKSKAQIKKNQLIVLHANKLTFALLVDEIEGIKTYEANELDEPLVVQNAMQAKYVIGLHQSLTTILNVEVLTEDLITNK